MRLLLLTIVVLFSCHNGPENRIVNKSQIAILPLDFNYSVDIQTLSEQISKFYNCKCIILNDSKLPKSAYYNGRSRYRADSLLKYLENVKPDNIDIIVGITSKDISATVDGHKDWGVFGYGQCPGNSSIISDFRFRKNAETELILTRFKNVAVHEIGHNFGLLHCGDSNCIMKDANGKLSSIEGNKRSLCSRCKNRLNFD